MTVKAETNKVKPTKPPRCPIHAVPMKYLSTRGRWQCLKDNCKQVAIPENDEDNERPILGRGDVELVIIDDPDGSMGGRFLLRAMRNNVMVDVTDVITQERTDGSAWRVEMTCNNVSDNRKRK